MLIDHVGLVFFPEVVLFRILGRIAMPLFAFFIAEGCYYTAKPMRYFLRVFGMAVLCQSVYFCEQLFAGNLHSVYLNILFTFSFSIPLCFVYLRREKMLQKGSRNNALMLLAVLVSILAAIILFDAFCTLSEEQIGIKITLDYGAIGAILPLFALLHRSRKRQMVTYAIGVILFALLLMRGMWYSWFSLLALPILWFYNGKRGSKKLQPVFYLFYPLHLAALYLIDMLV